MSASDSGGVTGAAWKGALALGDGWARWRGAVGDNALHRHLAAQAVLAGDQPVQVRDAGGRLHVGNLILIDPLVPHRLEPSPWAEIVFVEPAAASEVEARLAEFRERWPQPVRFESTAPRLQFWRAWGSRLPSSPRPSLRSDLASSLRAVDSLLTDGPVALKAAADVAGLSPERYRHLFAEGVGLPFRRYVLWRRLQRALSRLEAGADVTTAAHDAGFADSAHFARTFRAMLGIRATQVFGSRP